jgi:hypothetical protein
MRPVKRQPSRANDHLGLAGGALNGKQAPPVERKRFEPVLYERKLIMNRLQSLSICALLALGLLPGCGRNPADGKATGIDGTAADITGDEGISTAPGGEGSGPTGTGGQEPADNPGVEGGADTGPGTENENGTDN